MIPSLNTWSSIIKSGALEPLTGFEDVLFEYIDNREFDPELMKLNLSFNNQSTFYRIMRSNDTQTTEVKDSMENKQRIVKGLIQFINLDNFPDGIFLEITTENNLIFHIMELKRCPPNKFRQLSSQFLSAYIHCKVFSSIIHFDNNVSYKFYVVYNESVVNEKYTEVEEINDYNLRNSPRGIPGEPNIDHEEFKNWYENQQIEFQSNHHTHPFVNIVNIPLSFTRMITDDNNIQRKLFNSNFIVC